MALPDQLIDLSITTKVMALLLINGILGQPPLQSLRSHHIIYLTDERVTWLKN